VVQRTTQNGSIQQEQAIHPSPIPRSWTTHLESSSPGEGISCSHILGSPTSLPLGSRRGATRAPAASTRARSPGRLGRWSNVRGRTTQVLLGDLQHSTARLSPAEATHRRLPCSHMDHTSCSCVTQLYQAGKRLHTRTRTHTRVRTRVCVSRASN